MADNINITIKDAAGNDVVVATQDLGGVHFQRTAPYEPATFYVVFDRIAPAANKYMATLFNTSATRVVRLQQLWQLNWQVAAVTGVALEQYVAIITARTAGTSVPIHAYDSADTLSGGISADTISASVTESHIVNRQLATSEEGSALGTQLGEDFRAQDRGFQLLWERTKASKGFTFRQNQGITIRNVTGSTVGTVSYFVEFTDEPA
jgi:hypothetical protein